MKLPIIWLKDYVDTDKSAREIAAGFTQLGLMLDKPLDDSGVLDLEHRMDRADWLSIVGCARDFAAFENIPLKFPKIKKSKINSASDTDHLIPITVTTPHVRRFYTRTFRGIKVAQSPTWLKERLQAYGIASINNIVDITNFCMIELGQPMHAQDLVQLSSPEITIRQAKKGESLTTLLGTDIKLDPDTFVLTSGNQVNVIGGIVGGKNTGVTDTTTDIILDAGNYDQSIIRKTSRRLKIINETVSRNDKFLDPRLCELAIDRATALILELAGGTCYANSDYYPDPVTAKNQTLRYSRLELLSGMQIPVKVVKRILKSLEYQIVSENDKGLTVEIPYFRTDIEVEDDLVADILRINDYNNLPVLPLTTPVPKDITPNLTTFDEKLRDLLVGQGAQEHITSSLVKSDQSPNQVILANALSTDQNALRTSLVPALKNVLINYTKHKKLDQTVFEIGKTFSRIGDQYQETHSLSVVGPQVGSILSTLMYALGIKYQVKRDHQIVSGSQILGTIDSPTSFTLQTDALINMATPYSPIISEFSHTTALDLSFIVPANLVYADLHEVLSRIKSSWQIIEVISMTTLDDQSNNYLLRLTWDADSKNIAKDKNSVIKAFTELGITSKS